MKNISLEFVKIPEYIPKEIIEEKLENLNLILYVFHSKKNDNNKEITDTKKKDILKFLLKDYYNVLLISNNENKEKFQEYETKLTDFLKDKIKTQDIESILAKDFPQEFLTRKDITRGIIAKLNIKENNTDEVVVFQYGEIVINEANLNTLIRNKLTTKSIDELMQTWMVFQLNRYVGLDNAFLSIELDTTKAKDFFKNALNYEVILKERLSKNVTYDNYWDALNTLNKKIGLQKSSQKKLMQIFSTELQRESDNLFVYRNNVYYFNESNIDSVLNNKFNKERKQELTKFYLFYKFFNKIKNPDSLSESMFLLSQYAPLVKEKLFTQVSKNFISGVFEEIKGSFNKITINDINYELGCHASDTVIFKDRNNIIFNLELANKKLKQPTHSEEEKNQFAILYLLSQLIQLKQAKIKSWNKEEQFHEDIEFINLKDINQCKTEDYLKAINGLHTNKLLNVIHTFFKDLVLDDQCQELFHNNLLLKVLKSNILQTGKNKEKLLIATKNLILFNEENISSQEYDSLLKIYVFDKLFKNNKDLIIIQDNSVMNIEQYLPDIRNKLKNKVSEKDIYLKIKEIEKDIEIEPKENYSQFSALSIELDAKNDVSFMKNDMILFKHEKKTSLSTVFIRLDIVNKLLHKTIDSHNVKELVKLCLFSKLNEIKEGVLRNKNNHLMILNENCEILKQKIPDIIEKINGKVLDQEINTAMIELNENLPFDGNEDYLKRNVINEIKRQVGIKIKSPFKHLL